MIIIYLTINDVSRLLFRIMGILIAYVLRTQFLKTRGVSRDAYMFLDRLITRNNSGQLTAIQGRWFISRVRLIDIYGRTTAVYFSSGRCTIH